MTKVIVITIDGKAETFTQPEDSDNDGRVYELARERLRIQHTEVMRSQGKLRREAHYEAQAKIAEERRRKLSGEPEPETTELKPEPIAVKVGAKGAN